MESDNAPLPQGVPQTNHCTDPKCGCRNNTPIFVSVQKMPTSTVIQMLQAGANPNKLDDEGRSLLHHAAAFGRYETAVALIAAGATVGFASPESGITAMHLAARRGDAKMLAMLISTGGRHEPRDSSGCQPLHNAILYGKSEETVELLLQHNANVRVKTIYGLDPLALSAMVGSARVAHLLIQAGANVMSTGDTDLTALHLAAAHGAAGVAHVLLAAGADANARDIDAETPAMILGTGEGMDRRRASKVGAQATGRELLRAPAHRSRAWLWTSVGKASGSGCGSTLNALSVSRLARRGRGLGGTCMPVAAMIRYSNKL